MLLTKFEIEKFKSFLTRQSLPLAPITLLYGPNGGGKSAVIQALLMLRQSLEAGGGELIGNGSSTDLGSWTSFASQHRSGQEMSFSLTQPITPPIFKEVECAIELVYKPLSPMKSARMEKIRTSWSGTDHGEFCIVRRAEVPKRRRAVDEGTGSFDDFVDLALDILRSDQGVYEFESAKGMLAFVNLMRTKWPSDFGDAFLNDLQAEDIAASIQGHMIMPNRFGVPCVLFDMANGAWSRRPEILEDSVIGAFMALSTGRSPVLSCMGEDLYRINSAVTEVFANFVHIEPLRATPQRVYMYSDPGGGAAQRSMNRPWTHMLYVAPEIASQCNEWFRRMGVTYEVSVQDVSAETTGPMYQILLRDLVTDTHVSLADVGFGIGQMLPIMVHPLWSPLEKMICVQQPELHLHPRLQGHMADFFIDTACDESRPEALGEIRTPRFNSNQWLIETHSEAMMTRIQRRIREGKIAASKISVLYVDRRQGCGSVVTPLRLDANGDFIDEWPGGFFEDGFDDFFGGSK